MLQDDNIPSDIWERVTIAVDEGTSVTHHRMDVIWNHLSSMKAPDGTLRFYRLCQIAKLVIGYSAFKSQEERVFSMVRKNKTSFRPRLDPKGTLSSILTVKVASM